MIEENIKIHDRHSAEIKLGFYTRKKLKKNDFSMNIWMFIPNSLDINRFTYSKTAFYRDMKSNIRLITPIFILRDIAEADNSPLIYLQKAFNDVASEPTRTHQANYEYQIKMFVSILKSTLRQEVVHMSISPTEDLEYLVINYQNQLRTITEKYRNMYKTINVPTISKELMEYFRYGDECMSNIIEFRTFRLTQGLKKTNAAAYQQHKEVLSSIIKSEIQYKKEKNFPVAQQDNKKANNDLVYRLSMLKKYAESKLFLNIDKRKDGALVEQLLFSLAAGISMVFATVIAFSVQQKYGNLTMPLFVALVVSYMLKDRIKDFTRYYFAHKMGSKYFDHKITMSLTNSEIGWAKESMDFIHHNNVPREILKKRAKSNFIDAKNPANNEKVLLYRTTMFIDREKLDATNDYQISGVNSIIRFNILNFMKNMDNVDFPLFCMDESNEVKVIHGEKFYYISLVLQKLSDEQNELLHYRLAISSKGIHKVERL